MSFAAVDSPGEAGRDCGVDGEGGGGLEGGGGGGGLVGGGVDAFIVWSSLSWLGCRRDQFGTVVLDAVDVLRYRVVRQIVGHLE